LNRCQQAFTPPDDGILPGQQMLSFHRMMWHGNNKEHNHQYFSRAQFEAAEIHLKKFALNVTL